MTADSVTDVKKLPRTLRYVLALLAFSVFINYIDRGKSLDRRAHVEG